MAGIRVSGEPAHVYLSQGAGRPAQQVVMACDPTLRRAVKTTAKFN